MVIVQDGPVGGDCTFTGCVPSKALLAAAASGVGFDEAMARVHRAVERIAATEDAAALAEDGIDVVDGFARFTSPDHGRGGRPRRSARSGSWSRPVLDPPCRDPGPAGVGAADQRDAVRSRPPARVDDRPRRRRHRLRDGAGVRPAGNTGHAGGGTRSAPRTRRTGDVGSDRRGPHRRRRRRPSVQVARVERVERVERPRRRRRLRAPRRRHVDRRRRTPGRRRAHAVGARVRARGHRRRCRPARRRRGRRDHGDPGGRHLGRRRRHRRAAVHPRRRANGLGRGGERAVESRRRFGRSASTRRTCHGRRSPAPRSGGSG